MPDYCHYNVQVVVIISGVAVVVVIVAYGSIVSCTLAQSAIPPDERASVQNVKLLKACAFHYVRVRFDGKCEKMSQEIEIVKWFCKCLPAVRQVFGVLQRAIFIIAIVLPSTKRSSLVQA